MYDMYITDHRAPPAPASPVASFGPFNRCGGVPRVFIRRIMA